VNLFGEKSTIPNKEGLSKALPQTHGVAFVYARFGVAL
jgi:hypothetical protein